MAKKLKMFGIVFIVTIICNLESRGATINASSCSQEHVQSSIDAAIDGDTVAIPSGNCTWTGKVVVNKPLSLIGNGVGSTIISDGTPSGNCSTTTALWVDYTRSSNTFFRISGIEFHHTGEVDTCATVNIYPKGSGIHRGRLDNLKFSNWQNRVRGLWFFGGRGVIDNIWSDQAHMLFSSDNPDGEWSKTFNWGSEDAWYIESSKFPLKYYNDGLFDTQYGARVVFRYNQCSLEVGAGANSQAGPFVGSHGYDTVTRGSMAIEVYKNSFNNKDSSTGNWAVQFRGGTGYVYDNRFDGNWNIPIGITNYRSTNCNFCYSVCNGTQPVDGNLDNGWPCRDQIGRAGPGQTSKPLYTYNNCKGADYPCSEGYRVEATVYQWVQGSPDNSKNHIVKNRDFYTNTALPGYRPYEFPHPLTKGVESLSPPALAPEPPKTLQFVTPAN